MRHPKEIGDRSTLAIMYALRSQGAAILVPFGENTRYDLVVDEGGRLSRLQCKTERLRNGVVLFNTCSSYAHHPNPKMIKREYTGDIDEFAVFCPDIGSVYRVPIEDMPAIRIGSLRVAPARNGQAKGVRLAAAYEVARIDLY
jgi:hypothetical protein